MLVPGTNPEHDVLVPAVAGAGRKMGFVCAPALFQRVLIDCVDEPTNIEAYERNRRALTEGLSAIGYEFVEPQGAFYLFPDVSAISTGDELAELLLEKAHVAVVSGSAFGYPSCIRLSYAINTEDIEEAMRRIKAVLA